MKNITFKYLLTCSIFVMTSMSIKTSYAQTKNFSGTWKISLEKTQTPGVDPASFAPIIVLAQDKQSIRIIRIKAGQDEKSGYAEHLKFDGSPVESITPTQLKRSSSLSWTPEKSAFVENYTSRADNGEIKQTVKQTWVLSGDGKSLSITNDFSDGEHAFKSELVYEKQ